MASRFHPSPRNLQAPAEEACAPPCRCFAVWPSLWLASSCEFRPGFADGRKRSRSAAEASQTSIFGVERFECCAIYLHISSQPFAAKVERMLDRLLPYSSPDAASFLCYFTQ